MRYRARAGRARGGGEGSEQHNRVPPRSRRLLHIPSLGLGIGFSFAVWLVVWALSFSDPNTHSPSTSGRHPSPNKSYRTALSINGPNWRDVSLADEARQPGRKAQKFWVKGKTNGDGRLFYERILVSSGWVRALDVTDPTIRLIFHTRFVPGPDKIFSYSAHTSGRALVNRVPGEYAIWSKAPLIKHVRHHADTTGCDYTRIHPETYRLVEWRDCVKLLGEGGDTTNSSSAAISTDSLWFWKPPKESFGRGIRMVTLRELGHHLRVWTSSSASSDLTKRCRDAAEAVALRGGGALAQAAVHPPLLVNGGKIDIRSYLLIANTFPRFVFARFGHVRRCLFPYLDGRSSEKKAYVCNDYGEVLESPNFNISDHIWSRDALCAYISTTRSSATSSCADLDTEMKRVLLTVFESAQTAITTSSGMWSLLGVDLAVRNDMSLRVLEINTNPTVHYSASLWPRFLVQDNWAMMGETLEMVLMCADLAGRKHTPNMATIRAALPVDAPSDAGWMLLFTDVVSPPYRAVQPLCHVI